MHTRQANVSLFNLVDSVVVNFSSEFINTLFLPYVGDIGSVSWEHLACSWNFLVNQIVYQDLVD